MSMLTLFDEPTPTPATIGNLKAELSQYLTPGWAAAELTEIALQGLGRVNVLEPSCGAGAFLAAIPDNCPAIGVEIDPVLAATARATTGRHVIEDDFEHANLGNFEPHVILGNPPFTTSFFDTLLDRAHTLLPEHGKVAMIIPTHFLQTPSRVLRWNERFNIETALLPRTLFPGLSKTIAWTTFTKSPNRRLFGLLLFRETADVDQFRDRQHDLAQQPRPWRQIVMAALQSAGGEADLATIYQLIAPSDQAGRSWWKEKVRQSLSRYCQPLGQGRWKLA